MGKVIAGMTMSLDGFIEDRHGSVAALYPDFATLRESAYLQESIPDTGAVVMGRNALAMAEDPDTLADLYEYQVPLFILTHRPPPTKPKENDRLTFSFVSDGIASAIGQAKAAAGAKDVTVVGGASTLQQGLAAGLVDELHIDIMPVLLGGGRRPFDGLDPEQIRLERLHVDALPVGRTHLAFRVLR